MKHPKEPTAGQCNAKAQMEDFEGKSAFACWYPQMGGYVSKAVAVFDKQWGMDRDGGFGTVGGCIDVYVWHDGDFPFCGRDGDEENLPRRIHHCDPNQFIEFGSFLNEVNQRGCWDKK